MPPKKKITSSVHTQMRDWKPMKAQLVRLLEQRTGVSLATWNRRIRSARLTNEKQLRLWLAQHGVTGNPQTLLVMERFGYPDFYRASAAQLIDAQYADRPHLWPILDALLDYAAKLGEVSVQARKTYVSLVSPRRTFARIQPTTKERVDVGFRVAGLTPAGRLHASRIHETLSVQVALSRPEDVDAEVRRWLKRAYDENR